MKNKILVLDDDPKLVNSLCRILKAWKRNPFPYYHPLDALRDLERESFDLIISDFQMPKMNGIEFLTAVRFYHSPQSTPAFFITGAPSEIDPVKAQQLGAFTILAKPFEVIDLKNAIIQATTISSTEPLESTTH